MAIDNTDGEGTRYVIGETGWFRRKGFFRRLEITWKDINADLFKWDASKYGDEMTYSWVEEDNPIFESEVTWSANLNVNFLNTNVGNVNFSGTANFSIGDQDDPIDQSFVEYCDNTEGNGTLYRGTGIEFYLKQ